MDKENLKKVDSKVTSLKQLFSDKYEVDFFQREYVWQQKQLEDLVDDLTNEFLRNYTAGDSPEKVKHYDPYYMGEVVVSERSGTYSVIDGQQRITTFTLLLMWIKNKYGNLPQFPEDTTALIYSDSYGSKKFNLDVKEREACMTALNNQEEYIADERDPASVQNLVDRYNDIEDCFKETGVDEHNIINFIYWLEEKVMFSRVWTNSDEFAYVIFETMNDRGLSLTQVEMLRSYLLANITDPSHRERAMRKYDEMVKKLVAIDLGSRSKAEFEFFKVFLRSHYAEGSMSAKSGDSDFVQIGKQFHRWVRDNAKNLGLNTPADYSDFIDELSFFANVYTKINSYIESRNTDKHLYLVVNSDLHFTLQPALILASIKKGDSPEVIEAKVEAVSRYLTKVLVWRIWNQTAISQSSMEAKIYELCREIRDAETVEKLQQILDNDPLESPDIDNEVPLLNHQNINRIKVVLALITEIVSRNSEGTNYLLNGEKPVEVEHIWANHFDQHTDEFATEQEFSNARNNIGDLLVLPKGANASYGDLPYSTQDVDDPDDAKITHYHKENLLAASLNGLAYKSGAGFSEFRKFIEKTGLPFKSYEKFTKKSIDERANLYREILKWNWSEGNKD